METWVLTIVVQSIGYAIGLFKVWSDMQMKLRELDIRMHGVEKQDDEIYHKLDRLAEAVNDLNVMLQNKADR
jgi:hypothetical protein